MNPLSCIGMDFALYLCKFIQKGVSKMLQKQNQWIISILSEQKELIEEICELCKKEKATFSVCADGSEQKCALPGTTVIRRYA